MPESEGFSRGLLRRGIGFLCMAEQGAGRGRVRVLAFPPDAVHAPLEGMRTLLWGEPSVSWSSEWCCRWLCSARVPSTKCLLSPGLEAPSSNFATVARIGSERAGGGLVRGSAVKGENCGCQHSVANLAVPGSEGSDARSRSHRGPECLRSEKRTCQALP